MIGNRHQTRDAKTIVLVAAIQSFTAAVGRVTIPGSYPRCKYRVTGVRLECNVAFTGSQDVAGFKLGHYGVTDDDDSIVASTTISSATLNAVNAQQTFTLVSSPYVEVAAGNVLQYTFTNNASQTAGRAALLITLEPVDETFAS